MGGSPYYISTAAPIYCTSSEGLVDGGLMENNPTVDALVEMNKEAMKDGHPIKLYIVCDVIGFF